MKKKVFIISICALMLISLFAGCGSSAKDAPREAYTEESKGMTYSVDSSEMKSDEYAPDENNSEAKTDVQDRKLIETVDMTVETKNFEDFTDKMKSSVTAMGGYVEYSDIDSYSGSHRSAQYTLRIPTPQLDKFLENVAKGASVVSKTDSVSDVTLKYVDMESHLKALRTEEESLMRLLSEAKSVEDIITVQDRLTQVRYEIESYESQLRTMDNLIDYATVTMTVREVEIETDIGNNPTVWQEIGSNLSETMYDIGHFFRGLFVFLVSALPVLIILAVINVPIIIFAIVLPIKRHKKKLAAKAQSESETITEE